jgi:small subunit ribosomal protein S3
MGHKVNPRIFRIGISRQPVSRWFATRNFALYLKQDTQIRSYLRKKLRDARVARIEVERSAQNLTILIYTSRPGVIIGRGGTGIEELKKEIKQKFLASEKVSLNITIHEVQKPDLEAELVLQNIVDQLEKRVAFRRAMKRAIEQVMKAGALGVKIIVSGRLNGAEIARTEALSAGKIPLQTLRADVDYSRGTARTTYGAIGVKVWVYRGEIFAKASKERLN